MFIAKLALLLVIIGALNWGGIGLFGFDTDTNPTHWQFN